MTVYIDADACPVKEIVVKICKTKDIPVIMVMDYNHVYNDGYSKVITVDKGFDSADFKITNLISPGDLCVTGDYGLCSMILARRANCINFYGTIIDNSNIDELLFKRHINKELRKAKKRGTQFTKRTSENDEIFEHNFTNYLNKLISL